MFCRKKTFHIQIFLSQRNCLVQNIWDSKTCWVKMLVTKLWLQKFWVKIMGQKVGITTKQKYPWPKLRIDVRLGGLAS